MKISIIIPNYNGEKLLKNNLPIVISSAPDCEIVVVDDGSTDGSVNEIKYQKANIRLIQNKNNLGFASAVNRGVKEASGELVVLLNTDVVPQKDFLAPLIPHFSDPKVFAVGCLQKSKEKGQIVLRGRGVGAFRKGLLIHAKGDINRTDTLWVDAGAAIYKKEIWTRIGGMNEMYNPYYWEDIDISYRAQKAGYKILFEPKSVVSHRHDQGVIKKSIPSSKIKAIAYRNQFYFVWLNISSVKYLLEHILFLPLHIFRCVISRNRQFIKEFAMALINLPKIIILRLERPINNIIPDEEIVINYYGEL